MRLPTLLLLLAHGRARPRAGADPGQARRPDVRRRQQVARDGRGPVAQEARFGATFFVTEGFDFPTNKRDYMTWDEIAQLHRDGFEIGNHTRDHKAPGAKDPKGTIEQLEAINARCLAHGIPRPVSSPIRQRPR